MKNRQSIFGQRISPLQPWKTGKIGIAGIEGAAMLQGQGGQVGIGDQVAGLWKGFELSSAYRGILTSTRIKAGLPLRMGQIKEPD
jgi:hypothetical protein